MFSEAATDCTLATVCNKIEGWYRHNDQPDDEVRHGEAHDEHVGHRLKPLLGPLENWSDPLCITGFEDSCPSLQERFISLWTLINFPDCVKHHPIADSGEGAQQQQGQTQQQTVGLQNGQSALQSSYQWFTLLRQFYRNFYCSDLIR